MAKTEVYSWRMSPRLKCALEEAAHEEQERLQAAAMQFVGTIESGRSRRAENARSEVRARIARRHER